MPAGSAFLHHAKERVSSSSASSMNFKKPVVFDDGFHPVEGFQVDNHRLFLVFCIRDIFSGYCGHACIIPVFMRESIKELVLIRVVNTLLSPYVLNQARNSNPSPIRGYSFSGPVPVTGLIGALLITFSQITGLRAQNPEYPILPGEKPASLFPFGWQIVSLMGWRMGRWEKGLFWGIWNSTLKPGENLLLYLRHFFCRRLSSSRGVPTPKYHEFVKKQHYCSGVSPVQSRFGNREYFRSRK